MVKSSAEEEGDCMKEKYKIKLEPFEIAMIKAFQVEQARQRAEMKRMLKEIEERKKKNEYKR